MITFWFETLRPYLYKNYPIIKIGFYNTNADVQILIKQIEEIIKNKKKDNEIIIKNKDGRSQTLLNSSISNSIKSFKSNNNLAKDGDIIIEEGQNKNEIKTSDIINSPMDLYNNNFSDVNKRFQKSKSYALYKEMKPSYIDKDEIELKTIEYFSGNKIKLIDIDLLLKKVAENSFCKEGDKILYGFIKQSFSFLNIDIFLQKITNCYKFYKSKDKLDEKAQNLIEFFSAFIIEMIEYNKSNISDKKILGIINSFYTNVKNDIINAIKCQKLSRIKSQQIKGKILNEPICTKEKDKNGETIRWWEEKLVKQKLRNHHKRTILKYQQLKEKSKNEKQNNKKEEDFEAHFKFPNENEIKEIQNNKKLKRYTLINNHPKYEILKQMQKMNINNDNNNNETSNPSYNKNNIHRKSLAIKTKERLNEVQLIQIFGKKYEDLIMSKELLLTKEENFLLILKNIAQLLKQKSYSDEFILKTKSRENFYAKPFYIEYKENQKKLEKFKKDEILINESIALNKLTSNKIAISLDKKNYFCVLDYQIEHIGEKLISITKNSLNKIELKELYNAVFAKKEKYAKAPNIMENIQKFNNLIFFIVEDILSYDTPKDRAKIIDQWVLVANYCKSRRDQTNCLAINSALNHYIIKGLDQTLINLKHSTKNILKEISNYCTLIGNYKIFREEIKNINKDEYFLPYLGIILRDFIFFEEKGQYVTQGRMINFEKIEKVQNSIDSFFEFKNRFDKVKVELNEELNFFDNLGEKSEQDLEKIANDLEPEFKLGEPKEGIKRLTDIDIKYFNDLDKKE